MKLPWIIAAIWVGVFWAGVSRAEAVILINEVLADPPALVGDANGDGTVNSSQDEFVELVNTDVNPVSLAQWSLSDATQVRHTFSSSATLPGYSFFVVFGGGVPQGFIAAGIASTGALSLNNSGDMLTLRDANGITIDGLTYGAEGGMDVSLTRVPDASGSFVKHTTVSNARFSPGTTIDGSTELPHSVSHPTMPEPSSLILLGSGFLSLLPLARGRPPRGIMKEVP